MQQRLTDYAAHFRFIDFSLQTNHLHSVVEADDEALLWRAMSGLASSFARRLNRYLGRRGPVWDHRYHRHDLASPREAAHAIQYVLRNHQQHGIELDGLDPYSSAQYQLVPHARGALAIVDQPQSWLLRSGYQRYPIELPYEDRPSSP